MWKGGLQVLGKINHSSYKMTKNKFSFLDATFTSGALVFKAFQQRLFFSLFPEVPEFFLLKVFVMW